jgi:hypothetical protein
MRRNLFFAVVGLLLVSLAGCTIASPTATVTQLTATTIASPTATITPFVGSPVPTSAFFPTPTIDPNDPTHAPGTLRNTNWPTSTAAIATLAAGNSVPVDVGAVVLTSPAPQGPTLSFYVAIPPQRGYAARVNFPINPRVQLLQPGDMVRIVGIATGVAPLPPTEGTGNVVNINGQRLARNNEPLSG